MIKNTSEYLQELAGGKRKLGSLTAAELVEEDKIFLKNALMNNERQFIESILSIRLESGEKKLLKINPIQDKILRKFDEQREKGKPVRAIILKSRRHGCSTIIQAKMFCKWFKSFFNDKITHEFLLAHKQDSSNILYDMVKLFYDDMPDYFKPKLEYSNMKKLTMADTKSSIYVATAEGRGVGRAGGFNLLHLSEFASYEDAEKLMAGIMPTIPDNDPDSMVVIESTANGSGNMFHRMWQAAKKGDNYYMPLFFAWFDNPEYSITPKEDVYLNDEEKKIKDIVYKERNIELTDGQMLWRRDIISNKCEGDIDVFNQEYPYNDTICFLQSGRPVFHVPTLNEFKLTAPKPKAEGELVVDKKDVLFTPQGKGNLKIWEFPQEKARYIIGSDFAECNNNYSDFCAASCFNEQTGNQAAVLHGRFSPEEWVNELYMMGKYYNFAQLAPERNAGGLYVVEHLYHYLDYPNIYQHEVWDSTDRIITQKIGWETNEKTKAEMINVVKSLVREKKIRINHDDTLQEMIEYVYDDRNRANAPTGLHDDCLKIGTLIKTNKGYMPIEQIKIGDKVLTHLGNWKRVITIIKKPFNGDFYRITPHSKGNEIELSYNHPLYIARRDYKDNMSGEFTKREWKLPVEIKKTYRVISIIPTIDKQKVITINEKDLYRNKKQATSIKLRDIELDKDFAYLVGVFIADGCCGLNFTINIAFNSNELDTCFKIQKYIDSLGIATRLEKQKGNGSSLVFSSKLLWTLLKKCYRNKEKIVPEYVFSFGENIKYVLEGWLDGDGWLHSTRKGLIIGATTSQSLALDMRDIALSLGKYSTIQRVKRHRYDIKTKDQFWVYIYDRQVKGQWRKISKNEYCSTVSIKKEYFEGEVYNLQVEDDESFIANGIVVHNCVIALCIAVCIGYRHGFIGDNKSVSLGYKSMWKNHKRITDKVLAKSGYQKVC